MNFTRVVLDEAQKLAETALDAAYREMANDAEREQEATEWSRAPIGDVADAAR